MKTNEINEGSMLRVNTILRGAYRIVRYLSSGGFGNTYVAVNQFDETVAVKEFYMRGVNTRGHDNMVQIAVPTSVEQFNEQLDKFRKEAYRLRKLRNEHIVGVHDMFKENGTYYYVMDFINGESIGDRLRRTNKPLDEKEAMLYFFHMLDALNEVHGKGFFHLDIKPANILVENNVARLIDFGASKQMLARGGATRTAMCYTPGYAPSEQVDQQLENFGAWTDIYALGATLYSMVTANKPPMSGDIIEQGSGAFHFRKETSKAVRELIIAMMKPARRQRPQSVKDLYALANKLGIKEPKEAGEEVVEAIVDADEVELVEEKPSTPEKKDSKGGQAVKRINIKDLKQKIEKSKSARKEVAQAKEPEKQEDVIIDVEEVKEPAPASAASAPAKVPSKPAAPVDRAPSQPQPGKQFQPAPSRPQPSKPFQPAPSQPQPGKPFQPAPSQPQPGKPFQPAPSQPQPGKPFQPAPSQPQPGKPFQPAPSQPQPGKPFQPAPSQPQPGKPFQPAPSQPQPGKPFQPAPSQPQPGKPFQPAPSQPQPGKPFQPAPSQPQPGKPFQPAPSQPQPSKPLQCTPSQPQPSKPLQRTPSQPQPSKPLQRTPSQPQPSKPLTPSQPQRPQQAAPHISQPVRPKQTQGYEVRKPVVVAQQQPRPDPEAGRVKYEYNEKQSNSKLVLGSIIAAVVLVILTIVLMVKCVGSEGTDVDDSGVAINRVSNVSYEITYYDDNGKSCITKFTYTGSTDKGKPNGMGKGEYDDGEYNGKYKDGMWQDENATYTFTSGPDSGDTFTGQFEKNMFRKGEYYDNSTDQKFKGSFQNNKPYDGEWVDKDGNHVATVRTGVKK